MGQRLEHFESKGFSRLVPQTFSIKRERGHLTHLLVVLQGTTIREKDKIGATLRRDGGRQINVIDDISLNFFAQNTDLKFGLPAYGSVFDADQGNGWGGGTTTENEINGKYISAGINAVLIPVGSLYLENGELNINFDLVDGGTSVGQLNPTNGGSGICTAHIFGVDTGNAPAHVLSWEKTYDLESKHSQVRELYLGTRDGSTLFPSTVGRTEPNFTDNIYALDVKVQMDIDGNSINGNLYGYGAMTTIFGELNRPSSSVVRLFQDDDAIPSTFWAKVTGDDREKVMLIIVKEHVEPQMILEGHTQALKAELEKTQNMEKNNSDTAVAYQAVGLAKPSAEIAKTLELMPASI